MELTIDEFGRIAIPKEVRERLGLQPGMTLHLDVEADAGQERLSLRPVPEQSALQRRGHLLVHTGEIDGDLSDTLARNRDERARKLMGL